jgi:uncharacterized membrane protein
MDTAATPTPAPARRRVKKRILIPAIILILLLLLLVGAYVRGTWAATEVRNPQTAAEGTRTQLYRTPQGDVQVRCAILIDAPAEKVWDTIQDYGNHPTFLPYVTEMEVEPRQEGRVHLKGVAHSRLWGDWPFDVHVDHKQVADKHYVASWDEPNATMPINRGGWDVTGTGPNQTLVVFNLQVEAAGYPNFFVRNVLMDRMYKVVSGLRDEVDRRQTRK